MIVMIIAYAVRFTGYLEWSRFVLRCFCRSAIAVRLVVDGSAAVAIRTHGSITLIAVNNYQRDGAMRPDSNGGASVYYEPNSYGGATETPEHKPAPFEVSGEANSVGYDHHDHYTQPGDLYRLLGEDERARLVQNIVDAMMPVEKDE